MVSSNKITETSVVGAGVMGSGIAITMASKNIRVHLNDLSEDILKNSEKQILDLLRYLEGKKLIADAKKIEENVVYESDLNKAIENADIIFEAIIEEPTAKKDLFSKLTERAKEDAILTSNTSVIRIAEIASDLKRKEKIVGVHWMNPPYLAPLVELTPSEWTDKGIVDKARNFLENVIGKKVVLSPDIPGFIVNRFHAAVTSEAIRLMDEGVSIEDIDDVWRYHLGILYGLFGPLRNADYIGLDTTYLAGMYLSQKLGRDLVYVPEWFLKKLSSNEIGVKSKKGFYNYGDEGSSSWYARRTEMIMEELKCRKVQK
jgi:3-hydroxyacyl-CoA dehydrogenase